MNTQRIDALLRWGSQCLTGSESPRLDAAVLLAHAIGASRTWLHTWPEHTPGDATRERYRALVARRAAGVPIAHLTGEREFWSLTLRVTPDTLVPRPETETLVEAALSIPRPPRHVLDLGTGSGAIAAALAHEWPTAQVDAVERDERAAAVAKLNARRLGFDDRLVVHRGSWYEPLGGGRYDLIVSNPPYIDAVEPEPWLDDAAWEPRGALIADDAGLADIRAITAGARHHLATGGHFIVEHGWRQGETVRRLLADHGFTGIRTYHDLAGRERATGGQWLQSSA